MENWRKYEEQCEEDDFLFDEKKQKSEKFDTYKSNGKKPLWRSERTKAKQNNGKKNIK